MCKCGCGEECWKDYKRGHGRRGKKNSPEHNEILRNCNLGSKRGPAWNRGLKGVYKHSEEIKEKISKIAKEKGFGKWMKGRKMPKEVAKKSAQSRTGLKMSKLSKEKISVANKGEKNGMFGKKHGLKEKLKISEATKRMWKNPLIKKKIVDLNKKNNLYRKNALKVAEMMVQKRFFNTKPELKMVEVLKNNNINFIHPYSVWNIEHCYSADFYLPKTNTIVEVDGKYWHNYPYGTEKDKIRGIEMTKKGYNVIRVWEHEVENCFQKLSEHINEVMQNGSNGDI